MSIPKWLVNGLGGLLVAFVALLIIQKAHELQNTFKNSKPANTISVSGEGKVSTTPDLATVNIGVMSQATTAVDAKNQNNEKINKIISYVKSQGIKDADISTSDLNLYPQQTYPVNGGNPTITGYQQTQTVTVKVHGVDKDQSVLDKILDGVVNNGANQVNGVSLSVEDPSALQQKAQVKAIADAKQKAQQLAQEAGLTLGKVVSVSENSGGLPVPMPYAVGMGGGAMASKSIAPNIQTGSQEIDEMMTVTYEVK